MINIAMGNVSFQYRKTLKPVFCNVSAEFLAGKIIGLIGPNGAGKTTMFDIIMGNLQPTEGRLLGGVSDKNRVLVAQNLAVPGLLTIREVFILVWSLNGMDSIEGFDRFWDRLNEKEKERFERIQHRRYGKCSGGERRWALVSMSLAFLKKVFLLDEPTAGLDPEYKHLIWEQICRYRDHETCYVVSSHILDEISYYVDELFFLAHQRLQKFSGVDEFMKFHGTTNPNEAFVKAVNSNNT